MTLSSFIVFSHSSALDVCLESSLSSAARSLSSLLTASECGMWMNASPILYLRRRKSQSYSSENANGGDERYAHNTGSSSSASSSSIEMSSRASFSTYPPTSVQECVDHTNRRARTLTASIFSSILRRRVFKFEKELIRCWSSASRLHECACNRNRGVLH